MTIETTPLSLRVKVDAKGCVVGNTTTPLCVNKYLGGLQDKFYNSFTGMWEITKRFYLLDRDTRMMYFPLFLLGELKADILANGGDYKEVKLNVKDGATIDAPLLKPFKAKNPAQGGAVDFLTKPKSPPVQAVTLDPGLGKTVVSFAYTAWSKKRVLIHSPLNMKDWTNRILEWVNIPPEKIVFVSGMAGLNTLLAHVDEIDPAYILMPTQSLRPYLALSEEELGGRPKIDDLCEALGVHTRIIDEYHLHIETHIKLDLRIKVPKTIMLSATLESSSETVNAILAMHLPKKERYGGSIPNHVHVHDIGFTLGLKIKQFAYKKYGMYSHATLEQWLLKGGKFFNKKIAERVYLPIVAEHYYAIKSKGQKISVLVSTTKYGDDLAQKIKDEFQDLKVVTFYKDGKDKSSKSAVPDPTADVIVTTLKSGGTGTDIHNLITVLNTVAVKSSPENKQNFGRLRKIDGVNPNYVFTTWLDVESQKGYRTSRSEIYHKKAHKFYSKDIRAR